MDAPLVRADAMRDILAHFQVDVNHADDEGDTLLHKAAEEGNTSMVAALLAVGSVDRGDEGVDYALFRAAEKGYVEIVRLLLNAGGDPNVEPTSLHAAAFDGHTEVARLLIAAGADIHYADRFGNTPLYCTAPLASHPAPPWKDY